MLECDADFVPPLSLRVNILNYAEKLVESATRFEAWSAGRLVGLVAVYCNEPDLNLAFITSVSVANEVRGLGVATILLDMALDHVKATGYEIVELRVGKLNKKALQLYARAGFIPHNCVGEEMILRRCIIKTDEEYL